MDSKLASNTDLTPRLATEFLRIMRELLCRRDIAEVLRRHSTYPPGICATPDVTAASLAMTAAFENVTGRLPKLTSEGDVALWSASWAQARAAHLDAAEGTAPLKEGAGWDFHRFQSRYPHAQEWDTGGGNALRLECGDGGELLITDSDGGHIPEAGETEVALGRYARNGDPVNVETIPVSELHARIDAMLERARHPRNVADYFVRVLHAGNLDDRLHNLPVDSPCGMDCIKVIDTAAALIEHCRVAFGYEPSELQERTIAVARSIADQVIAVYCNR